MYIYSKSSTPGQCAEENRTWDKGLRGDKEAAREASAQVQSRKKERQGARNQAPPRRLAGGGSSTHEAEWKPNTWTKDHAKTNTRTGALRGHKTAPNGAHATIAEGGQAWLSRLRGHPPGAAQATKTAAESGTEGCGSEEPHKQPWKEKAKCGAGSSREVRKITVPRRGQEKQMKPEEGLRMEVTNSDEERTGDEGIDRVVGREVHSKWGRGSHSN